MCLFMFLMKIGKAASLKMQNTWDASKSWAIPLTSGNTITMMDR